MSRKRRVVKKRVPVADPVYNSKLVTKFINRLMHDGKKSVARGVMYDTLTKIKEKTDSDPLKVFELAMQNVGPRMEVRPRRVGGASYQVPQEVRGERKVALAIRWMITSAEKLSNKEYRKFSDKLAQEIIAASKGEGEAIRKRDVVHKMAEDNRAFAHFRW